MKDILMLWAKIREMEAENLARRTHNWGTRVALEFDAEHVCNRYGFRYKDLPRNKPLKDKK